MPIAYILAVLAALTPAQWLSLLGLIPEFVKLAEEAQPVIKDAVALFAKAVHDIEGLKSKGVPHAEAVRTVGFAVTTPGYAVQGWNDEETKQWLDRASPTPGVGG